MQMYLGTIIRYWLPSIHSFCCILPGVDRWLAACLVFIGFLLGFLIMLARMVVDCLILFPSWNPKLSNIDINYSIVINRTLIIIYNKFSNETRPISNNPITQYLRFITK